MKSAPSVAVAFAVIMAQVDDLAMVTRSEVDADVVSVRDVNDGEFVVPNGIAWVVGIVEAILNHLPSEVLVVWQCIQRHRGAAGEEFSERRRENEIFRQLPSKVDAARALQENVSQRNRQADPELALNPLDIRFGRWRHNIEPPHLAVPDPRPASTLERCVATQTFDGHERGLPGINQPVPIIHPGPRA